MAVLGVRLGLGSVVRGKGRGGSGSGLGLGLGFRGLSLGGERLGLGLGHGGRTTPIGSLAPILSLSKMAKTSSVDSRRAAALASRLSLKVWFHTGLRLLSTTLVVPSVRLPHMMTTYGSELFFPKRLRSLATRSRPAITVQSISTLGGVEGWG